MSRGKKTSRKTGSGKRKAARRPVDQTARSLGSLTGLVIALWACWQLLGRSIDLPAAGRMAIVAVVVAVVVERLLVPAGRILMGRPQRDQG